jgi:uncharacterized protein DUF2786
MTDSITEKVRKLLRLAKSANQHESESALAKAMELAALHQIDVSALSEDAEIAKLVTRYFRCGGRRLSREWREALGVARKFFNVTTCIMQSAGQVAFVGTESDVQIADYVTGFLVRTCRVELEKFTTKEKARRLRMSKNKRASFINAFFGGVWLQLSDQRTSQVKTITGLEIVLINASKARDAHLAEEIGETTTCRALDKPRDVKSTLFAGYDAGFNTLINPALGTDAPLALDYRP